MTTMRSRTRSTAAAVSSVAASKTPRAEPARKVVASAKRLADLREKFPIGAFVIAREWGDGERRPYGTVTGYDDILIRAEMVTPTGRHTLTYLPKDLKAVQPHEGFAGGDQVVGIKAWGSTWLTGTEGIILDTDPSDHITPFLIRITTGVYAGTSVWLSADRINHKPKAVDSLAGKVALDKAAEEFNGSLKSAKDWAEALRANGTLVTGGQLNIIALIKTLREAHHRGVKQAETKASATVGGDEYVRLVTPVPSPSAQGKVGDLGVVRERNGIWVTVQWLTGALASRTPQVLAAVRVKSEPVHMIISEMMKVAQERDKAKADFKVIMEERDRLLDEKKHGLGVINSEKERRREAESRANRLQNAISQLNKVASKALLDDIAIAKRRAAKPST